MKIYLTCFNPAIDRFAKLRDKKASTLHRLCAEEDRAGGKAVNIARAFRQLGESDIELLVWTAGETGLYLKRLLAQEKIKFSAKNISNDGQTRINFKIGDSEYNGEGPEWSDRDYASLKTAIRGIPAQSGFFVISGAPPKGAPPTFYTDTIAQANKRKLPVALDAEGPYLAAGLKAQPFLVKVNNREFNEALPKRSCRTLDDYLREAKNLVKRGVGNVFITFGARGAMGVNAKEEFFISGNKLAPTSSVGAGDAFLAGVLAALRRNESLKSAGMAGTAVSMTYLETYGK